MDPRFRVDLIAATPNPQQCVYAGMHQDYSEGFVADDRATWPDEQRAGEICVKRLLAGTPLPALAGTAPTSALDQEASVARDTPIAPRSHG